FILRAMIILRLFVQSYIGVRRF
ncbi:uncharacterized protein METZ01_LOCUS409091, partial [marine metagenome]